MYIIIGYSSRKLIHPRFIHINQITLKFVDSYVLNQVRTMLKIRPEVVVDINKPIFK